MTNEEAIHNLKVLAAVCSNRNIMDEPTYKSIKMAIDALEKQIPMKPTEMKEYDDCIDWLCPKCGRFHRNDFILKYCSNCGQKIGGEEE